MKPSQLLNSMLMATTMLIVPTMAVAQDAPAPQFVVDDQIIVRGTNIPDPQRATSQVASFLSEEDLARTGDSNAALALTRLSGLSVVGGKFAFVRGLGDRYSAARLNGSPLPSPEPLRRTVPLDLFPSNILRGATVQKTFSPNYPGEFGGGIIDLETIRDPGEPYLNVKYGVGLNTVTTATNGLFVNGGDLDFLGYDDGLRSIPGPLQNALDAPDRLDSLTDAELEIVGESLINSPLSVIQEGTLGPDHEFSIDGGYAFDLNNDMRLGLVGVVGYKSGWTQRDMIRQVADSTVGVGIDLETESTTFDATVNALGTAALEFGDQLVQATGLYIHSTSKESQIDTGFNFNAPGSQTIQTESSSFLERELIMGQLAGEHLFADDFQVDWRGAFARSNRNSPYERTLTRFFTTTDPSPSDVPLYAFANNNSIDFSDLKDNVYSAGIDIKYDIPLSGPRVAEVAVGYEYSENDRRYRLNALQFAGGSGLPLDVQEARTDFLFSPDNIGPTRFTLNETSTATDSYDAELLIHGVYAQLDAELIPTVRTTVGVRYEDGEQTVQTFDPNVGAGINNDYFLPSATVTWNFTDDMQFRLGYSHTVARPQFRELAPSLFFDPVNDRNYRGNTFLVDSEFRNYDARYEFYLGRNQFITLAGFYKEIENPIEELQFSTSTFSFDTTFINSPNADLYGGEFEYRSKFEIPWNDWFLNREWLFSVNYTYTKSEIQVEAGDTIADPFTGAPLDATLFAGLDGAALVGTPEHIVNAQFGWEDEDDQFTLLLGWVDERILQRGSPVSGGLPDVTERPGIQLDAVYRQNIVVAGTDVTLGISARNLLGTDHEEVQFSEAIGETPFRVYDRGRSLSATVTAKF